MDTSTDARPQNGEEERTLEARTWIKATLIFIVVFTLYYLTRSASLDDFDSVNFALGLHSFDLWNHQPHPPGYPLFIFFGWLGGKVFGLNPETSLLVVSTLGGALFISSWFLILRLQFNERLAWWAAACLTIMPGVWMTATKVLTDSLAAGFLSAEILATLLFCQRSDKRSLVVAALFGAAATGTRPQLIPIAILVLVSGLWRRRASLAVSIFAVGCLIGSCLVWLLPMWYTQWRLQPQIPFWLVYPKLVYAQWTWRLDKPHAFLGAGDWSVRYLAMRFGGHIFGWFGLGFGMLVSPIAIIVGALVVIMGLAGYVYRRLDIEDRQFWKFHGPWALFHIGIIFICLPADQRYYLVIYPLLAVALLRGYERLPAPYNRLALALPALLLCIAIPTAIQNHCEEAPLVRVARYLGTTYSVSQRPNVALLFTQARRHAEWYAPGFRTFLTIPPPSDLPDLLKNATAVYTDDENLSLPAGWKRFPVAEYKRSPVVYWSRHIVRLFRIQRSSGS
ncbi:MAG: glycosyltransferase family 39 protein [Verrucomicrobia bacterium]|nr:glycosyltransferase family 39 protein [Verrucomicrobiota bacterium]